MLINFYDNAFQFWKTSRVLYAILFFQINGNSIAYTIEIHIKTCNKKITFLKFVIELHYTLKFVLKTNFILKFLFKNKFHTKTH